MTDVDVIFFAQTLAGFFMDLLCRKKIRYIDEKDIKYKENN
jgi:hypothetical protein